MEKNHQITLQPVGKLPAEYEFGQYTPQPLVPISPNEPINLRKYARLLSTEVQKDYASTTDYQQAHPTTILRNLLIPIEDPRRKKGSDPEQLVVTGRDLNLPEFSKEAESSDQDTFYYPGTLGVVFDSEDFKKVVRSSADLAKVMKSENRRVSMPKDSNPDTEEKLELSTEELGFRAIRAAIHTLDGYIVGMDELSSSLQYQRNRLARFYNQLNFPTYAHHNGKNARRLWGETDSKLHKLADLSALNAPQKFYGISGMHRAIRNNLYASEHQPADVLRGYISQLIKPYTRAKYEKVRISSMVAVDVRNRHLEMLPPSMQGKVINDSIEAYGNNIVPKFIDIDESTSV